MQEFKFSSEKNHSGLNWIFQNYSVLNSSNDIRNPITGKSNSIFNGWKELIKDSNLHQRNHFHTDLNLHQRNHSHPDLKPTVTALSRGSKPTADWNHCHADLTLH